MYRQVEELREMVAKVQERIRLQEETLARIGTVKMGAKLNKGNELTEWLDKQEYLKACPM